MHTFPKYADGAGKWPDGTVSSWFSFIHALYQNVIYDRISDSRKAKLHQTIGERLEAGYKDATEEIAAELATHFERGGDQSAHNHLEQAIPHYDFEYHRSTVSLFGWDPGVLAYCYDAQTLYFLGFPERAEQAANDALALVKNLASPFNEALCRSSSSVTVSSNFRQPSQRGAENPGFYIRLDAQEHNQRQYLLTP